MGFIYNYNADDHSKLFKQIGKEVMIWPLAKIVDPHVITIGDNVIIDDFVFIMGGLRIKIGRLRVLKLLVAVQILKAVVLFQP